MSRGFKDLKVFQLDYQQCGSSRIQAISARGALFADRSDSAFVTQRHREHRRRLSQATVSCCVCSKMADADGEAAETSVWLDYARDCGYWSAALVQELATGYEEVGRMLAGMISHPEKFAVGSSSRQ